MRLLIPVLLITLFSCGKSNDVGLGIIHFEDTFSQRLHFYNKRDTLSDLVFYIDITYEDSVKDVRSSIQSEIDTLIFAPLYMRDYSSLVTLRVIDKMGDWYKVYTDEDRKVTHWVYVKNKVLEKWTEFWPKVQFVKSAYRTNQLRKDPSDEAMSYNFNSQRLCLKVLTVDGAWMKVRNTPVQCENPYVIQEEFECFLRWKKEGELLVYFTP